MGAVYRQGATKSDIVREQCESEIVYDINVNSNNSSKWAKSGNTRRRTITKCVRGNILWQIVARETRPDANTEEWGEVKRSIVCTVLKHSKGYGWGCDSMGESHGPFYHDCPLSYLEMVEEPDNEFARQWRARVRDYHAQIQRSAYSEGDTLVFDEPIKYRSGLEISAYECFDKRKHLFHAYIKGSRLSQLFKLPPSALRGRTYKVVQQAAVTVTA